MTKPDLTTPERAAPINEFDISFSVKPDPEALKHFIITTQQERYDFSGFLIGHASSENPDSKDGEDGDDRWTEIDIYKTESGTYISHIQGVSLRYHSPKAKHASGRTVTVKYLLDTENEVSENPDIVLHIPCAECVRMGLLKELEEYDLNTLLKRETIRHTVGIAKNPRELIDNLRQKRTRDDSMFLSSVSQQALAEAARNDPSLRVDQMSIHIP
jgi:hypothetical protein